MTHRGQLIRKVELTSGALLGLAMPALALWLSGDLWWSLGLGGLIGLANFHAMAVLTDRLTQQDVAARLGVGILLPAKLIALIAAIGLTMWLLQPHVIALVVGLSLAPLCLMGVVALEMMRSTREVI